MIAYFIFSYLIKMGKISLLKKAMQEVAIILQILFLKKPKYVRKMFYWMHILDIQGAHLELQKAYIVNKLINFQVDFSLFIR